MTSCASLCCAAGLQTGTTARQLPTSSGLTSHHLPRLRAVLSKSRPSSPGSTGLLLPQHRGRHSLTAQASNDDAAGDDTEGDDVPQVMGDWRSFRAKLVLESPGEMAESALPNLPMFVSPLPSSQHTSREDLSATAAE
mmetsp:Transcript_16351/g.45572  ORF Transcript_16351/g.45572 Transcript_16351/m.45572 type:complete len:138 (-) Transcript_16351:1229-1642(-)